MNSNYPQLNHYSGLVSCLQMIYLDKNSSDKGVVKIVNGFNTRFFVKRVLSIPGNLVWTILDYQYGQLFCGSAYEDDNFWCFIYRCLSKLLTSALAIFLASFEKLSSAKI